MFSEASNIFSPSPGLPIRLARGIRTLSKLSGQVDRPVQAHLLLRRPDRQTLCALLQDQDRNGPPVVGNLGPLAEQEVEVRNPAIRDEGLRPVDDNLVAIRLEPRLHPGRVRSRVRLGDRQRAKAPFGDARQQAGALLVGAEIDQRLHAVEGGGIDDARRRACFRDDRDDLQVEGIGHPRAAEFLRHEDGVEAEFVDRRDVLPWEIARLVDARGVRPITSSVMRWTWSRIMRSSSDQARAA